MFLFCKEYLLLSVAEQTIKTKLSFLKRNVLSLLGKKNQGRHENVLRHTTRILLCHLVIVLHAVELFHV